MSHKKVSENIELEGIAISIFPMFTTFKMKLSEPIERISEEIIVERGDLAREGDKILLADDTVKFQEKYFKKECILVVAKHFWNDPLH